MKTEVLQDALELIRDDYILDAHAGPAVRKKPWLRWGALAACLCILAAVAAPRLLHKAPTPYQSQVDHMDDGQPTHDQEESSATEFEEAAMKKAKILVIVMLAAATLILLVPKSSTLYDDGGTMTYDALAYKIIIWNRLLGEENEKGEWLYHKTSVFWFPNNQKTIDELWELEYPGR